MLVDGVDVDAAAAAVRSCSAVDDLVTGTGPAGGVVTYLPGRQVAGVQVRPGWLKVAVRGRWGIPVPELARQVRAVLLPVAGPRRVEVVVADLTDAPGEAFAPELPVTGPVPAAGPVPLPGGPAAAPPTEL